MATIVTRSGKGSPLTNAEVDANFTNLNDDKAELSGANFTGSIDVTGTVTADGLKIDGGNTIRLDAASTTDFFTIIQGGTQAVLTADSPDGAGNILFKTAAAGVDTDRMQISGTGDISFYENTGTTPKFYWDASAESLGIGTTSPTTALTVAASGPNGIEIDPDASATTDSGRLFFSTTAGSNAIFSSSGSLRFTTGATAGAGSGTELMRIGSGGNVGIGTISPSYPLDVRTTGTTVAGFYGDNAFLLVQNKSTGVLNLNSGGSGDSLAFETAGSEAMRIDANGNVGIGTNSPDKKFTLLDNATNFKIYQDSVNEMMLTVGPSERMLFGINGSEAMRITANNNLLVGTTVEDQANNSTVANAGIALRPSGSGALQVSRDGAQSATFNRLTSDGDIVQFRKDGTTVGLIGTSSNRIYIGTGDTGLIFSSIDYVRPWNPSTNSSRDNAIDLGGPSDRFDNLYLGGGVYLGGTGAANLLDDYEAGTWTPVVSDANSGGNTATGTFSGRYTKIGNLVTIQCSLVDIDTTGMTAGNRLTIQSLPFSSSSANASYGAPSLQNVSFTGQTTVFFGDSRLFAYLREFSSGGTFSDLTVSDFTSGSADVFFVLQYEAA